MLVKGNTLPKVYWLLIIPIMLLTSYQNLFKFGKVQHYHIDELEYYGRILFYLITSFAESIIYIVFIWLVISIVKKVAEKWGDFMDEQIGWLVVLLMIFTIMFCLVRQIYDTWILRKLKEIIPKRTWVGHLLMCGSLFGLLVSYVLNILVAMQLAVSNLMTSNSTNLGCFLFLAIYFIAKFGIIKRAGDISQI